jgi:hypothetical protein
LKFTYHIILVFTLASFKLSAGLISVKGNIKDYSGKIPDINFFSVELVEDYITQKKVLITEGEIDAYGNFNVSFSLDEIHLVFLDFGKVERSFLCVPGKSYFIEIRAPFRDLSFNHGLLAKDVTKAEIKNKSITELNNAVDSLEKFCSDFLAEKTKERKIYSEVKKFTDNLSSQFKYMEDKYFLNYLEGKKAEMMMYFHRTQRDKFIQLYLENKSEIVSNLKLYQVVYSFYKGNFKNIQLTFNERDVVNKIINKDVKGLINSMHHNNRGEFNELKELILLIGLNEISLMVEFKKNDLNSFLDAFIQNSSYKKHKIIAKNIKLKINHLQNGSIAPRLMVQNKNGNFDIQDERKNFVYLCFFKSWDETFMQELKVMNYLQRRFEEDLKIVCISTDIDTNDLVEFKKGIIANKINVDIYHYGFDADILLNYRITDYRLDRYDDSETQKYFLINSKGILHSSPARKPSKGFEQEFKQIVGK